MNWNQADPLDTNTWPPDESLVLAVAVRPGYANRYTATHCRWHRDRLLILSGDISAWGGTDEPWILYWTSFEPPVPDLPRS